MVALRKRTPSPPPPHQITQPQTADELAPQTLPPAAPVGVAASHSPDAAAPNIEASDDRDVLRKRLEELRQAEEAAARQRQAEIIAAMQIDAPQRQEKPQLTERDLEFLGARPGIDRDPEFIRLASSIPGYGTDRFYKMLEAAFPLSDYRSADKLPSDRESRSRKHPRPRLSQTSQHRRRNQSRNRRFEEAPSCPHHRIAKSHRLAASVLRLAQAR